MNKLAMLKTIFRNINNTKTAVDVLADKLDDNSVDTINIVNNAVTEDKIKNNSVTTNKIVDNTIPNNKIADNTLQFNKMHDDVKYISTDSGICCLSQVGGFNIGDNITNKDLNYLLKKILIPYTKPLIGIPIASVTIPRNYIKINNTIYQINNDFSITNGNISYGIGTLSLKSSTNNLDSYNGDFKLATSGLVFATKSKIFIESIRIPVMIKSENITSINANYKKEDSTIISLYTISNPSGFLPNQYRDFTTVLQNTLSIESGANSSIELQFTVNDEGNPEIEPRESSTVTHKSKINFQPYVFFMNSSSDSINNINELFTDISKVKTLQLSAYTWNNTGSFTCEYQPPINEYSYLLFPYTTKVIRTAKDKNGFTQSIEEITPNIDIDVNRWLNINGSNCKYRIFRAAKSSMSSNPKYTFNITYGGV